MSSSPYRPAGTEGPQPIVLRSAREIARLRRAGQVVRRAHEAIAPLVRPGVTTASLDAVAERIFSEQGAEPLFKGVPGKVPFPATCCISVNEQVVHGIPGRRVLCEGDIVSIDTGCRLDGWCADAAVTHGVGTISPQAQLLLDVTSGALALAIRLLGEKERWSEIAARLQAHIQGAGFSIIREFVGHGIGRELHEPPQVPNFVFEPAKGLDFRLEPGLVLAIEPMVAAGQRHIRLLADHWTQATADGGLSAHFEHTVALTAEGVEVLTGPG